MSLDPWSRPLPHPLTVADSPYARCTPYPATITEPLAVGGNPASGAPLQVQLWDAKGAKFIHVMGPGASGKTVLLGDLAERVTACPDAVLLQASIHPSARDDTWARLAGASALGSPDLARLVLQFACEVIDTRPCSRRTGSVHQPSEDEPLYVVAIDDIAAVAEAEGCGKLLAHIAAEGRSEGVALVGTSTRGTVAWARRSSIDTAVWAQLARPGEIMPGIFGITELRSENHTVLGRAFALCQPADVTQIVMDRLADWEPPELESALADLTGMWSAIIAGWPVPSMG